MGFQAPLSMLSRDKALNEAELEEANLEEALGRGAVELGLMLLQWKLQVKLAQAGRMTCSVDPELFRDADKLTS